MQISTKGRYALRLMLDLAVHNTGERVKIKDISARENISEKYLEQIISSLKKAGYVKSLRGAQGGYMLAREPETYETDRRQHEAGSLPGGRTESVQQSRGMRHTPSLEDA